MNGEKIDRRVRRTRELLRGALVSLVLEKGYERVTVQDIIDRADVGRSTFYAHFRDKEDLLLSGFDELRPAFQDLGADSENRPTLAVFEHAARSREIYKAMIGKRGAEVVRRYIHRFLSELMRAHMSAGLPQGETPVPLDVVVEFAVSAIEGLLHWWVDTDSPLSPEEMNDLYLRLAEPGIRAALVSAS